MNQRRKVAVLGGGDLGKTLVHQLEAHPTLEAAGFYDDTLLGQSVLGLPVLGGLDAVVAGFRAGAFEAALMGIGYKHLSFRARIFDELRRSAVPFATLIDPSVFVHPRATVDEGAVIFPRCVLDAGARVGANSLLNTACVVAHDSTIGPHTFLGPGVTLAGFVRVGTRCFLGVGTVVIDGITVGDGGQTGGGAVVTRDVEPSTLVVGVPARKLRSLAAG